jgi:hypothetical protein
MDIENLRADLDNLLGDDSLFEETNLHTRNEAIVFIKYAGDVLSIPGYAESLDLQFQQALKLRNELQEVNENLFQRVRTDIQNGNFTPESLRAFFDSFTSYKSEDRGEPSFEYDGLDILVEQVLFPTPLPSESRKRASGMIRYEATPARIILEMIDTAKFISEDVFIDIGSGFGLVVMLVNLLTGIRSIGIEYDPVFCEYAKKQATNLRLGNVSFINIDARDANLNIGNIFYLFTPFVNEIFDSVLERLRYTSIRKPIHICSYGTITYDLVKLPWLQLLDPAMEHDFRLAVFASK